MESGRKNIQCRSFGMALEVFLFIAMMFPVGAVAAGLSMLDQSLAKAVTAQVGGRSSLSQIVQHALAEAPPNADIQNALAQREALAAALDQVSKSGDSTLDLAQAGLLVEVLQTLDSARVFEKRRGLENALPILAMAIWQRYIAPALVKAATVRLVPLAPRATGEIVGQWLDGGRGVRAFDLWADDHSRTLSWSRIEFTTPVPDAAKLMERGTVGPPPRKDAKLAFYVDVSGLHPADRDTIVRAAEERAPGGPAFVLDDLQARVAACLDEGDDWRRHKDQKRTDAKPKTFKAGEPAPSRKVDPVEEDGPNPRVLAEARCRDRLSIPGLNSQAMLFDPKRRIRVLSFDLTDVRQMLNRVISVAQVWP